MIDWKLIRPKFREIREARGLDSLASEIGAGRSSVDRWARGICAPDRERLPKVARVVARHTSQVGQGDRQARP